MVAEIRGSVPKLPFVYSKTLVNRAWRTVREANLWSFNLFYSTWITPPPIIGTGGVTTTQGLPTIQFDAVAKAAINAWQLANPYVFVTQLQFRLGVGGIYNLIQYDPVGGGATLDIPFADPSVSDLAFQLYQLYYVAPYKDFLGWISVRNPQMFMNLDLTKNRAWVDDTDPQRTWYQFPSKVIPYGPDLRGQGTPTPSATLGYPMFELWGQPVTPFTYQCYGLRRGADLANPTDTLPLPVGEDLILAKAREYAYEWAEANKAMAPRAVGPDFKFLIGKSMDLYTKLMVQYRREDREFVDNYAQNVGVNYGRLAGVYNTLAGVASPYTPWG
jgi:hypothetical protein